MTQHLSLRGKSFGRRRQSTRTPVSTDFQGDRIAWVLFRGSMRGRMRNWKVITKNKVSIVPPRLPKEGAMPAAFPKLRPCSPDAAAARAFPRFSAEGGGEWGVGGWWQVPRCLSPWPRSPGPPGPAAGLGVALVSASAVSTPHWCFTARGTELRRAVTIIFLHFDQKDILKYPWTNGPCCERFQRCHLADLAVTGRQQWSVGRRPETGTHAILVTCQQRGFEINCLIVIN